MTAIPEKRPPKAGCHEKSTKEKTLESGSGFLPNVSRNQLLQLIRGEKDPVARDRLLAYLHRKKGFSIRCIYKIMVPRGAPPRPQSRQLQRWHVSCTKCSRTGGSSKHWYNSPIFHSGQVFKQRFLYEGSGASGR